MSFTLEKATEKDLNSMLALFKDTIENSCSKDYNEFQISAWTSSVNNLEKWKNRMNNQYFIIAKENNKIVGFGSVEGNYLDLLFVHHNFLRKGIATLIYNDLKQFSSKKGFSNLTTYASKTALAFFISKGFSIEKENKVKINEIEIDNFKMILNLN